jgi:hypothetical protein
MDVTPLEMVYRYKVRGEKWGFQRTDLLRMYPFDLSDEEGTAGHVGYIPEGLVWLRIAQRYFIRYVNDPLRIYYTDAPSITRGRAVSDHALGLRLYYEMVLNEHLRFFPYAPLKFVKAAVQYARASFHRQVGPGTQWSRLHHPLARALWLTALPVGAYMYRQDASPNGVR